MPTQQIIRFIADGIPLIGTLHLPDTMHPPFVIGCHGLLADRSSPKQIALAEALNQIGIAYFRFDHQGCGESQGRLSNRNLLSSRCSDLHHAIDAMQRHGALGEFGGLFGSSFGGTVVLATAAQRKVPLLATYAAPISSRSIKRPSARDIQSNTPVGAGAADTYDFDITPHLPALHHILILHGDRDEIVPVEHARQIHQMAGEPKKLVIHRGGDHRMTHPVHQKDFLEQCLAWFRPIGAQGI